MEKYKGTLNFKQYLRLHWQLKKAFFGLTTENTIRKARCTENMEMLQLQDLSDYTQNNAAKQILN